MKVLVFLFSREASSQVLPTWQRYLQKRGGVDDSSKIRALSPPHYSQKTQTEVVVVVAAATMKMITISTTWIELHAT